MKRLVKEDNFTRVISWEFKPELLACTCMFMNHFLSDFVFLLLSLYWIIWSRFQWPWPSFKVALAWNSETFVIVDKMMIITARKSGNMWIIWAFCSPSFFSLFFYMASHSLSTKQQWSGAQGMKFLLGEGGEGLLSNKISLKQAHVLGR